jgi:hypothetical protein
MTPEEQKAAQEAEAAAQAAAAAAAQEPKTDPPPATTDDPKILRAELERARKEAAQYRTKARDAAEKERKAAEEKALAEGKFKEVAEAREKRAKELEAELEQSRARLSTYEQQEADARAKREAQVASEFAALPEEIRSGIPDDDLRAKEIAVSTFRVAKGAKPPPPINQPTAPRPAAPDGRPPVTVDDLARAHQIRGNPRSSKEDRKAAEETIAKHRAWKAEHPG